MTGAGDTSQGRSARQGPSSAGLEALIEEVAGNWKRAARAGRLLMAGDYSLNDANADMSDWLASTTRYAVRAADELCGRPAPMARFTGTWSTTMTVFPEVTKRPLTLRSNGLTALGTDFKIDPSNVAFDPKILQPGWDTFQVSVWMANVPRERTLIFKGDIVDDETGEPVTDALLADNSQ